MLIKDIKIGKEYTVIKQGEGVKHNLAIGTPVKALKIIDSIVDNRPRFVQVIGAHEVSEEYKIFQLVEADCLK